MDALATRPSGLPRYLEIANELRLRIARGEWHPGGRLPSNRQLGEEFDVTPVTAREAVKYLEARGVLDCRRGSGTYVATSLPRIQGTALEPDLQSIAASIKAGQIEAIAAPDAAAEPRLPSGLRAAEHYTRLVRLALSNGEPLMVADVWLDTEIYRRAPEDFEHAPVLPLLMHRYGEQLQRASQIMTVEPAASVVADALKLMPWALVACMQVTLRDERGTVVYAGTLQYPAEAVRVEFFTDT